MSLSDEERIIVVELELEKANVAYNETIWLMEKRIVERCCWTIVLCIVSCSECFANP